jgi:hypothetical protein
VDSAQGLQITGVHPKVVQERLGHAEISVTMDIYSHVIPSLHEEAADLGAALLDDEQDVEDREDEVGEPTDDEGKDETP